MESIDCSVVFVNVVALTTSRISRFSGYLYHLNTVEPWAHHVDARYNATYHDYLKKVPEEEGVMEEFLRHHSNAVAMALDVNGTLQLMANPQRHDMPHFILCQEHLMEDFEGVMRAVAMTMGIVSTENITLWLNLSQRLDPHNTKVQEEQAGHIHLTAADIERKRRVRQLLTSLPQAAEFMRKLADEHMGGWCGLRWATAHERWKTYYAKWLAVSGNAERHEVHVRRANGTLPKAAAINHLLPNVYLPSAELAAHVRAEQRKVCYLRQGVYAWKMVTPAVESLLEAVAKKAEERRNKEVLATQKQQVSVGRPPALAPVKTPANPATKKAEMDKAVAEKEKVVAAKEKSTAEKEKAVAEKKKAAAVKEKAAAAEVVANSTTGPQPTKTPN